MKFKRDFSLFPLFPSCSGRRRDPPPPCLHSPLLLHRRDGTSPQTAEESCNHFLTTIDLAMRGSLPPSIDKKRHPLSRNSSMQNPPPPAPPSSTRETTSIRLAAHGRAHPSILRTRLGEESCLPTTNPSPTPPRANRSSGRSPPAPSAPTTRATSPPTPTPPDRPADPAQAAPTAGDVPAGAPEPAWNFFKMLAP